MRLRLTVTVSLAVGCLTASSTQANWGYHELVGGQFPDLQLQFTEDLDYVQPRTSDGAWKLVALGARCREILGQDVSIHVLAHSEGTSVALTAIRRGLQVRNVFLMGSPLRLGALAAHRPPCLEDLLPKISGVLVNLSSPSDLVGGGCSTFICPEVVCGIGNTGLAGCAAGGRIDVVVRGVIHSPPTELEQIFGAIGTCDLDEYIEGTPWWWMEWLSPGYPPELWQGPLKRSDVLDLLSECEGARAIDDAQSAGLVRLQQSASSYP